MKRKFLHIVFLITINGLLSAQSITNVKSKQEGNTIVVTYDLQCDVNATISLYVSEDGGKNFTGPLGSVSGDVGLDIKPDTNKKIVWDVRKDRDVFYGKSIAFRVKAIPKFGTFKDSRDGITYKTVKIGSKTWMAENLNYSTSSGSWCYEMSPDNCQKYGRLYNWETAQNVCPSGWRLPSKDDFENLLSTVSGGNLNYYTAYNSIIDGGSSGFSAVLNGWEHTNGRFCCIGSDVNWWSSSESDINNAWYLSMNGDIKASGTKDYIKELGFSVRCIKN
jgi:uncharacterized protein (TIGR02145 family)